MHATQPRRVFCTLLVSAKQTRNRRIGPISKIDWQIIRLIDVDLRVEKACSNFDLQSRETTLVLNDRRLAFMK